MERTKKQLEHSEQIEQNTAMPNRKERPDKKVLIVHQQVLANTLKEELLTLAMEQKIETDFAKITVASWFMLDDALKKEGDLLLRKKMTGFLISKKMNMTSLLPTHY